jgi:hypothetical protein
VARLRLIAWQKSDGFLSQWAVNGQMRSLMIVLHLVKGRLLQTQPRNDRSKTHQLSIFAEPLQMPATPRRLIY